MAEVTQRPDVIVGTTATGLPTFKRPRFAGLRIAVNEALLLDGAAARLRWAVRNAETEQVCACGRPATVAKRDGWQRSVYGGPVFYACDQHARVPLDAPSLSAGERCCLRGCGYRSYLDDTGAEVGWHGPIATSDCAHEWSPAVMYAR